MEKVSPEPWWKELVSGAAVVKEAAKSQLPSGTGPELGRWRPRGGQGQEGGCALGAQPEGGHGVGL